MKRIIFIETSDVGAFYTAEGSRRLGYEPLFVCNINNIQGDTRLQIENEFSKGNVIDVDTTSIEKIKSALIKSNINFDNIIGVMTFLDSRLELSIQLAKELDCSFQLDSAILNLKSKSRVQELIPEYSPKSITFKTNNIPYDSINERFKETEKIIIKPTKLAGAIGAEIFNKENYLEVGSAIHKIKIPEYLNENEWICQDFIEGQLLSIEGFVRNKNITYLGISDRSKVGFTESQLNFPVDQYISEEKIKDIHLAIELLVNRSGFLNGFFHIEFIMNSKRIYIIDANIGRLGGGPLGELIPMSYGVSIIDFYAIVIKTCLSGITNLNSSLDSIIDNFSFTDRIDTIGLCYGSSIEGYFNNLKVNINKNFKHTLILNQDQIIESMGANNWTWIGLVSSIKENFSTDISSLQFCINQKDEKPCY
jgi:predicted ATP-grasp superfamily ATP-dependent carboligase